MKEDLKNTSKLKVVNINDCDKLSYLYGFSIEYLDKAGKKRIWEMISRGDKNRLRSEIFDGKSYSDSVMIFATDKDKQKVVLLKEFRIIAGKYVYMLPAGLVESGEDIKKAAIREFKEETGMNLEVKQVQKERYISVGTSNEKTNIIYGYFSGEPSTEFQEINEDAQIVIVDKKMAIEVLEKEEVVVRTAMLLEQFFGLNPFLSK